MNIFFNLIELFSYCLSKTLYPVWNKKRRGSYFFITRFCILYSCRDNVLLLFEYRNFSSVDEE